MKISELQKFIKDEDIWDSEDIESLFVRLLKKHQIKFSTIVLLHEEYLHDLNHAKDCIIKDTTDKLYQLCIPDMQNEESVINGAKFLVNKFGKTGVYFKECDERTASEKFYKSYGGLFERTSCMLQELSNENPNEANQIEIVWD